VAKANVATSATSHLSFDGAMVASDGAELRFCIEQHLKL
jgi:hypothetical protein